MARRKKANEESENLNNTTNESDDTFGLPEIEYEPLKRDEPVAEETPNVEEAVIEEPTPEYEPQKESMEVEDDQYVPPYLREEKSSKMPVILGVSVGVLLVAAAVWFFAFYQPKVNAEKEKVRLEAAQRRESARKLEAAQAAKQKRLDDERRIADSLAAATPAIGLIETLSERSGRYYVVVASSIDDDLIMDYAKKLSQKGVSSKIIPPFGKTKFSRIAIDVADTYADAQANADSKKGGDYGDAVWVVKY
jgi:cytoskeletal protein RodZ